jgi:outer membrane protein assembly factor BamD (BamD/ComL family)
VRGRDEYAFDAYQNIVKKYPRSQNYEDVLWRQYEIANRFLGGEFFRVFWGYLPLYPSMDETAKMYGKIVDSGPYSSVAPHAQLRIGAAREKQKDYEAAVRAYEAAADRYHNQPAIAADAMYRAALSYQKQATTSEYDQGTASKAIAAYTDFMTFYPEDKRVAEAQKAVVILKAEQVRGNFGIAQYYEKNKQWTGAVVYYNEVLQMDPNSPYAAQARPPVKMRLPAIFLVGAAALLAGCAGYHFGPVDGGVAREKSIEVLPFNNQTLQPRLGDAVTQALRERLQVDVTYHLATHGPGDVVVSGVITRYHRQGLSYLNQDATTTQNYRVDIVAHVVARERATGKILLDKNVNAYALVNVGNDLASSERQAAPLLAEDLARNIAELLTDGAW